jgi:succinoglycan biosynthesis protein ExoM
MDPHIDVCIPTFRRPQQLLRCLEGVAAQERDGFTLSLVVVDNDPQHSAQVPVLAWASGSAMGVVYAQEAQPNIALARNNAVARGAGSYLAFIDDDEVPEPTWLRELFRACRAGDADGVLGPVLPRFDPPPPRWLAGSGLCERARFPTGTPLTDARYMRTGNVLLRRELFTGLGQPFDPRLGCSGGEDADFFSRMLQRGRRFTWCDEAVVHEAVPRERQTLRYHVLRALIRGVTEAGRAPLVSVDTVKSVLAIGTYGMALPVLAPFHRHLFARYLVRCGDHLGKVLARLRIPVVRERTALADEHQAKTAL